MGSLKDNFKYTPPNFRIFEKYGHGYLYVADQAVSQIQEGYWRGAKKYNQQEFLEWPNKDPAYFEHDLLDAYAGWAKADDMFRRLEGMPAEERQKHLDLDKKPPFNLDYDEIVKNFVKYTGNVAALELERGKQYEEVLDGLLKRRIECWEKHLDSYIAEMEAEEIDPTYGVEPFEVYQDLCNERSTLEYARDGIGAMRMDGYATEPRKRRLQNLPFWKEFQKRLKALDGKFRRALGNDRLIKPWADPSFWWHHTPKKSSTK
jgi:hypothetical protein